MKRMAKLYVVMAVAIASIVIGFASSAMAEAMTKKQFEAINVRLNSVQYALWQSYLAMRLQKGEETLIVYAAPYLLTDGDKLDNSEIKRFEIVLSGFIKHGWRPAPSTLNSDSDYQVHVYVQDGSASSVSVVNYKKNRHKAVIHSPGYVEGVVKAVEDIGQMLPLLKMQW